MTDANCHQGAWHKYSHHRRKRDSSDDREPRHGNKQLCVNVRCIQVLRVMAKFGAKPQAFPYDIQFPYLEFKSKAYPLSLLKERFQILKDVHRLYRNKTFETQKRFIPILWWPLIMMASSSRPVTLTRQEKLNRSRTIYLFQILSGTLIGIDPKISRI